MNYAMWSSRRIVAPSAMSVQPCVLIIAADIDVIFIDIVTTVLVTLAGRLMAIRLRKDLALITIGLGMNTTGSVTLIEVEGPLDLGGT